MVSDLPCSETLAHKMDSITLTQIQDHTMTRSGLYAVYDTVADMIIGGLQVFRHDAAAVRFFNDVASIENSMVGKHPADFQLLRLGWMDDSGGIDAERDVLMEGAQWAAINQLNKEAANAAQ